MIYDTMQHVKSYRGVSEDIDTAIDYLCGYDLSALSDGRHSIDGDRIFAHVSSYYTSASTAVRLEAHRKFIDIQVVTKGAERCYYAPAEKLEPDGSFSSEKDVGYFEEPPGEVMYVHLVPGVFAVFFPSDAHKPTCHFGEESAVHKVVVKVAIE